MPVRLVPQQGKYVRVKASFAVLHYNPIGGTKDYLHGIRQRYLREGCNIPGRHIQGKKGGKQVKSHQDVQQYQALAPGCPLPEVYGVLEFADGCKGNLERHHIF